MYKIITEISIFILTGISAYLLFRNRYIRNKYFLYEIKDEKKKKIIEVKGDFLDIEFKDSISRIKKINGNNWIIKNKSDEIEICNNQIFDINNKKYMIINKQVKGGLFLFCLIFLCDAISLSMYLQGQKKLNYTNDNLNEYHEVFDNSTTEFNNQIDIDEKYNYEESEIMLAENDIYTIVNEYSYLFQNKINIDWNSYKKEDNLRYNLDGFSELGINATKYQDIIDWNKAKEDGIGFTIIQVGSRGYETGEIHPDIRFRENIDSAKKNNIKVGLCFYSQAISKEEMDEEIDYILSSHNKHELEYPIGIALVRKEGYRTNVLTDKEYIALIKYFCIRITLEGYTPMILGETDWFNSFPKDTFKGYLKLVGDDNNAPVDIDNCIIWAYAINSKGVIKGINSNTNVTLYISGYQKNDNDK